MIFSDFSSPYVWYNSMKKSVAFSLLFVFLLLAGVALLTGNPAPDPPEIASPVGHADKPALEPWPRKINPLHVVVVFTKFKGEAPEITTIPSWSEDLFNGQPGSVTDYFRAVSFGQIKVTGEILPKMYEMPYDSTYYKKSGIYTHDIIQMLDEDPDFSFARCDNDGIDGIPNSGDDDGYADYIVLIPRTRPYDFIFRLSTGVMTLNLYDTYYTHEKQASGSTILVDKYSGCIAVAQNKSMAIGTVTAEIAHAFGADDLMDKAYDTPVLDSAGVGCWDILGWGATGWNGATGIPVGPCAYNRMLMKSIGVNNVNLVDLYGVHQGIRIKDVGDSDGKIYRIWVKAEEYFLIEYRNNEGNLFYDMQLPKSGLLIWHISERESNSTEQIKLCDLECPDGLYRDAGYPLGKIPDTFNGYDNLDYWAHDESYSRAHAGNMGDATDVYDGVTYTAFGTKTNPGTSANNKFSTGIEIYNIRHSGNEMLFDCFIPPLPTHQPHRAPVVGLGFQRSNGYDMTHYIDFKKYIYLVNFGLTSGPDLMVTVSKDSVHVREVTALNQYEVSKIAVSSLGGGEETGNAALTRENVSSEEFARALRDYGVLPEDLGLGAASLQIQKITLAKEQPPPFVPRIFQTIPILSMAKRPFHSFSPPRDRLRSKSTTSSDRKRSNSTGDI